MKRKASHTFLLSLAFFVCLAAPSLCGAAGQGAPAPDKAGVKAFTDFYDAQSRKLYGHLIKAAEYCNTLNPKDEQQRPQDALAIRASLSACWELFLNAGDMAYVYGKMDPNCPQSLDAVRELVRTGLTVVAGKLEKELQWLKVATDRARDIPISLQAKLAAKDIEETAKGFRELASLFDKPSQDKTARDAAQGPSSHSTAPTSKTANDAGNAVPAQDAQGGAQDAPGQGSAQ